MLTHRPVRGDTLIEVLISTAVFSFVAMGSITLMNRGIASAQRSLEITLVRQEMNAQADALRYVNASYIAAYQPGITNYGASPAQQWKYIIDNYLIDTSSGGDVSNYDTTSCPTTPPTKSFIMDAQTATIDPSAPIAQATTYSQVDYSVSPSAARGIWLEAVRGVGTTRSDYIDFHIRACWSSPGQLEPVNIGTIVRLYEPI